MRRNRPPHLRLECFPETEYRSLLMSLHQCQCPLNLLHAQKQLLVSNSDLLVSNSGLLHSLAGRLPPSLLPPSPSLRLSHCSQHSQQGSNEGFAVVMNCSYRSFPTDLVQRGGIFLLSSERTIRKRPEESESQRKRRRRGSLVRETKEEKNRGSAY